MTLLLALLCCWAIVACARGASSEAPVATLPVLGLQIEAPTQTQAGRLATVVVHATPITATSPILLLAQGTFGLHLQQQALVNGRATFTLSPQQTQYAGTVLLTANVGLVDARAELVILPGPAVDPLLPAVGPRSLVANGQHWTMVVATPRDQFLNPVAEDTPVTLRAQHPVLPGADPTTGLEIIDIRTRHLLAWGRIYSQTRAGQMLISATSGAAHSPERAVMEVPGLAVPFALAADQLSLPADGRQLVHIQSEQIVDRFGNVLLDGSNVTVLTSMANGDRRSLPAMTVDGRIDLTLQAPSQPGEMTVTAWIAGVSSQSLQIEFTPGPAVEPIALTVEIEAQEIVIVAGPLVGQLKQFIPDGTEVMFSLTGPDGTEINSFAPTTYGYATLRLPRSGLVAGAYTVAARVGTGAGQRTFRLPP